MRKKKMRGLRRRCRTYLSYIADGTTVLPNYQEYSDLECWSFYVPLHKFFSDDISASTSVKKFFIQAAINRVQYLIDRKTEKEKEYRIYFVISLPNLQNSNILILFSKRGIDRFWEGFLGEDKETAFYSVPQNDCLSERFGLYIPEGLSIRGYKEAAGRSEYPPGEELWFIGELH